MPIQLYEIVRFYRHGRQEILATGQTLEDAKAHWNREDTHKLDTKGNPIWFDGFRKQ